MTRERNWAEHDAQIRDNPTLEDARRTGAIHASYGWSCTPWGHWSQAHKEAYRLGYDAQLYQELKP
jgi:hypothetical protein